jgi:hypothetical protein
MAVAIIGGVITSTFLTLLVIPSIYDSIEIKRDHLIAKFHAREARWNAAVAAVLTAGEIVAFLTFTRLLWRIGAWALRRISGRGRSTGQPVAAN